MGPDRGKDLHALRPYFLAPILGEEYREECEDTLHRIQEWADQPAEDGSARPVTDLIILAHGWHENLFRATSTYDRISSRLWRLIDSGRLPVPPDFRPLFVKLHYHSDPGRDGWTDRCGRRDPVGFMRRVREVFEPASGDPGDSRFSRDFERIFEFFTSIGASDRRVIEGKRAESEDIERLTGALEGYRIKEAPDSGLQQKVTMAWRCYHEANPLQVLGDQDQKRVRFLSPLQALEVAAGYLAKALGPAKIAGLILLWWLVTRPGVGESVAVGYRHLRHWLDCLPPRAVSGGTKAWIGGLVVLGIAAWGCLKVAERPPSKRSDNPAKEPPIPVMISWLYLQVLCAIPLLVYCVFTFLLGRLLRRLWLFDERIGKRNEPPEDDWRVTPRYLLAQVAAYPATLLRKASARHSSADGKSKQIDGQLSFWLMQRRSVQAGGEAAVFVANLVCRTPALAKARVHFFGHSFGTLLVANLVRHLVLDPTLKAKLQSSFHGTLESLSLFSAANGSHWFEGETRVRESVRTILCTYSRYDTASGFYYPFTNHSRTAAGYLGLAGDFRPQERAGDQVLVQPPDLGPPLAEGGRVINVDVSRLFIPEKAAGGAHDSIFNDEAMYLFWAATGLSRLADRGGTEAEKN